MFNKPEYWRKTYETLFWQAHSPFDVKFEIEKTTRVLLERDVERPLPLTFRGTGANPPHQYRVDLVFEAAEPGRNLYRLQLEATSESRWNSEKEFRQHADARFAGWQRDLQPARSGANEPALYDHWVRDTLAKEAEAAARKDDVVAIGAIQERILAELRAGKRFMTSHKEGGTTLAFHGNAWVADTYGEEESRVAYQSKDEFLTKLRDFYDWESRRDSYPHRPPEVDVWNYIEQQLR